MISRNAILIYLCAVVLLLAQPAPSEEPALPMGLEDTSQPSETGAEPDLPVGLDDTDPQMAPSEEPALPTGLFLPEETKSDASEPALPGGLGGATQERAEESMRQSWMKRIRDDLPFDVTGFWETRAGLRTQRSPGHRSASMGETRIQIQLEKAWERFALNSTTDFIMDAVARRHRIHLDEGKGFLDIRELNAFYRPSDFMDVKVGRQILTWGTGDLLFINDLFPKDWKSFFIGRDDEYLKAPSDALKTSFFTRWINADFVYTPAFNPDRYIDGERISFYNAPMGKITGRDDIWQTDRPNRWFTDDEFATRLYRNVAGTEMAAYGYYGYWKSPGGMDPQTGRGLFPRLAVYGLSARRPVAGGIGNSEIGYYDSLDDHHGSDPFVRNSEFRALVGYERELATDLTGGLQYYWEHMVGHDDYQRSMPPTFPQADQDRQVATVRLTKMLMNQNLTLSLFTYYSPTDRDVYLRPKASYKITDAWSVDTGANIFFGDKDHTFFNQFQKNSNVYLGLRWNF